MNKFDKKYVNYDKQKEEWLLLNTDLSIVPKEIKEMKPIKGMCPCHNYICYCIDEEYMTIIMQKKYEKHL